MQKTLRRPFGLGLKAFFIIILMLLLWIPLLFIDNLVSERQGLQRNVIADIAQSTSKEQLMTGPVLVLPYRKVERQWKTLDDGSRIQEQRTVQGRHYFLPDSFNYHGNFATEQLNRGIYQARLYKNEGHISGHFSLPAQFGISENFADYQFEQAFLAIGISDVRGIRNTIEAYISESGEQKQDLPFEPGSGEPGLGSGIHALLPNLKQDGSAQRFDFVINLDLQGTSRFQLNPIGRETTAQLIGKDLETDLAVLKIDLDNLPVIHPASGDNSRIGDVALAIGNPFGVGQTVTMGIISATGRNQLGLNTYEDFIQTDAAINPGNSGGALIDAKGQLIGINTATLSGSGGARGIGFAIPLGLAQEVMQAIIQYGAVIRGWLGVDVQPIPSELAQSFGLNGTTGILIVSVHPGGPAQQAGLQAGDVILSINGQPTAIPRNAMNQVARTRPGEKVTIEVLRGGKPLQRIAEVSRRQPEADNTDSD